MDRIQYDECEHIINYAARSFYYHLHLNESVLDGSIEFEAINKCARFWLDYRSMTLQTCFILLGKVFSNKHQGKSNYSIHELSNSLTVEYFSLEKLRERKMAGGNYKDWIDDYIKNAHELSQKNIRDIKKKLRQAHREWEDIKGMRNKVFAHGEILSEEEKQLLFASVTRTKIEGIIQTLLNVMHVLQQAEINGQEPDFNYIDNRPNRTAELEVKALLDLMAKGYTSTLTTHISASTQSLAGG